MKELDLGSKLYYIDKKTEESREVEAVYVDNNGFGFYFDGTPHKLPYTVIGSRLYISRADAWNAWWNAKKRKMPIKSARKQTIKKTEANRNERRTSLSPTQAPLPSVQAIENGLPEPCNQNLHSLDNVETLQSSSAPPHGCDTCQLRRNGTCTLIRSELCDDYRAVPWVSEEKRIAWADKSMLERFRERGRGKYKGGFQNQYSGKIWGGK